MPSDELQGTGVLVADPTERMIDYRLRGLLMHETQITDRDKERFSNFVEFIARFDLVEPLLAEHQCVNDKYCAVCKSGKYSAMSWPCTTAVAAAQAQELTLLRRYR